MTPLRALRRSVPLLVTLLGLLIAGHYIYLLYNDLRDDSPLPSSTAPAGPAVAFNERFIEGLSSPLDLADPDVVFQLVFAHLSDEVDVYPTENYYYFQIAGTGRMTWGNLRLDAMDRDSGLLHLGYFEFDENGMFQDTQGVQKTYSAEDGVVVRRLSGFEYSVEYGGRRVLFRLHDIGATKPPALQLRVSERFVGRIFDESGLRFSLVFDSETKHFMYVLDEEGFVPEEFYDVSEGVVAGKRTGFAFYPDEANGRKLLVGVNLRNWERNNYYDGPFDQLPDNYVDQTEIARYIEEAYPYTAGQIDRFGGYKDDPGARVLIAPYYVYSSTEDLSFVQTCKATELSEAEFYRCITPDFYQ